MLIDLFSPSPTAHRSSPRIKEYQEWKVKNIPNDYDSFRINWYKTYLPKFKTMKKILFTLFITFSAFGYSQSINSDKTSLTNFIKRMYNSAPFEGVKVIDDYDHQYFISVLSLEKSKYPNEAMMNRVAQVKGQSQANIFFNGSTISSDLVIKTTENKSTDKPNTTIETIESIKENALGFVKSMELLTNFDNPDGKRMVFIFYKEMSK